MDASNFEVKSVFLAFSAAKDAVSLFLNKELVLAEKQVEDYGFIASNTSKAIEALTKKLHRLEQFASAIENCANFQALTEKCEEFPFSELSVCAQKALVRSNASCEKHVQAIEAFCTAKESCIA